MDAFPLALIVNRSRNT